MRPSRSSRTSQCAGALLMLLLALATAAPTPVFAQVETGQIAGTVSDPQGAVVAGASITVTSKGTGALRTATTTGDGLYTVPSLQPGAYEVKIEASGFGVRTVPVQVSVGTKTTVDVELAVTTSEKIDVVAGDSGVQVNTENQTLQTVVTERQI